MPCDKEHTHDHKAKVCSTSYPYECSILNMSGTSTQNGTVQNGIVRESKSLPNDVEIPLLSGESDRKLYTEPRIVVAKTTSNVLVLFELEQLTKLSTINLALCLFSLMYVAVNSVGFFWNCQPKEYRESIEVPMHNLEFWATLMFALVEVLALIYSPRGWSSIAKNSNPLMLKVIVFLNVVTACVSPLLYSLDPKGNEWVSHEVEYANEVCTAFIDLVLLRTLVMYKRPLPPSSDAKSPGLSYRPLDDGGDLDQPGPAASFSDNTSFFFMFAAFLFAVSQTIVYNFCDNGEQLAHYMEFIFGICAGGISFWFCMDNKLRADNRIENIICGCQSGHHV